MKNWSIKQKLFLVSGFFLFIIIATNAFQTFTIFDIKIHLEDISKVQLPAVRKMTLIDMHHDGLVGIVYKAVYANQVGNKELLKESKEDYEKSSAEFTTLLKEIDALPLTSKTKKAIEEAREAVNKYLHDAGLIIDMFEKGNSTEGIKELAEFNQDFTVLEEKLGGLGELIEKDAENSQKEGNLVADNGMRLSLIFAGLGVIIGAIVSWFLVQGLVKGIADTVEVLSASVHDVQNSSQTMIMVSKRLSSSVETQASSITESVTAMDEISSMIQNNNSSASNALNLSGLTKKSAESGKDTVNKMQTEMQEIALSYDEIQASIVKNKEDISKIVDVINQVAKKTEVINDIVFQTKLLSFNASVEAARAGESGKGFAVVAEEVGNLAVMSGNASKDIEQMLKESQGQVSALAESTTASIGRIVELGRGKIERGNKVSKECLIELEQILSYANDLDGSISEISGAIKEQSIGVEEVNKSLKQLDHLTHESADMSEKSKDASERLKNQSHALRVSIQSLRQFLGAKKSYSVEGSES